MSLKVHETANKMLCIGATFQTSVGGSKHLACLLEKLAEKSAFASGLFRMEPVPIHTVALPFRSAPARTVKSANSPAPDGRSLASVFSALRP